MMRVLIIALCAVSMAVFMVFPAHAHTTLDQAAANIESAIGDAMSRAGQQGQPTLGQLGGVQSGSSGNDAGGGAGGDSGSSGGSTGGAGGDPCFLAGTPIAMADGTSKPIEAVEVGEMIVSLDPQTESIRPEQVLETKIRLTDHYYIMTLDNGTVVKLTDNHPLWAVVDGKKGWASISPASSLRLDAMQTQHLNIGDLVFTINCKWSAVIKLERVDGEVKTYNLESVSNTHTFFAGGVAVHNYGGGNGGSL